MTDTQYLARLENLLSDLPPCEKEEALNFVREYFEEAREHDIDNPAGHLGSPEEYARTIREGLKGSIPPEIPKEAPYKTASSPLPPRSSTKPSAGRIWLILLSPFLLVGLFMLLVLLAMLFVLVLALVIMLGGIVLSGILGSFILLYKAVILFSASFYGAVFDLGCALFSLFLAYFAFLLLRIFFKRGIGRLAGFVKNAWNKIRSWFSRIWNKTASC